MANMPSDTPPRKSPAVDPVPELTPAGRPSDRVGVAIAKAFVIAVFVVPLLFLLLAVIAGLGADDY